MTRVLNRFDENTDLELDVEQRLYFRLRSQGEGVHHDLWLFWVLLKPIWVHISELPNLRPIAISPQSQFLLRFEQLYRVRRAVKMFITHKFWGVSWFYLEGQIKLVFWICGHGQGLFLESLFFQKVGNSSAWLFRNCWKDLIGCIKVFSHNSCLIL